MEFLVTQIDEVHYNGEMVGYQCFDGTGQSVKVKKGKDGYLQNKWPELQVGRAYSFTMGEFKGYPYVKDFEAMSEALASKLPQTPTTAPATPTIAPQERGMWMKEIGDWMRSGKLMDWEEDGRLKPAFCKALRTTYWANLIAGAGIEKAE